MIRKTMVLALCAALSMGIFAGCAKNTTESSVSQETETTIVSETTAATQESVVATTVDNGLPQQDRSGNSIVVPTTVNRIVSMAPSTTQVLIELGLSDKIVGIDTNSVDFLEDLNPDVAQFDMMSPDNEAIAALTPDIVFTSGMSSYGGTNSFQALIDAGICVADIPSSASLEDIAIDLAFIGDCVGKGDEARAIVSAMDETISQAFMAASYIDERKSVLFMMSIPTAEAPTIYTFGSGTYMGEMLDAIGADNVCIDQEGWIALSVEDAVAMNPDVILTNVNWVDDPVSDIMNLEGWENVTAIENGDVYYVDSNLCSRPNNHIADAVIAWGETVYPEYFDDIEDLA